MKKTVLCVWSVLQPCKRRIVEENPIREGGELIVVQFPERERSGGIGSCILTFDPPGRHQKKRGKVWGGKGVGRAGGGGRRPCGVQLKEVVSLLSLISSLIRQ